MIFRRGPGWYVELYGRIYGPWPMRGYAQAGQQVEIRRAKDRAERDEDAKELAEKEAREVRK